MDADQARKRVTVRGLVSTCARCPNPADCRVPFSGPSPARFAILGEAPGRDEVARGQPFVGQSGSLLRKTFSRHRIDLADQALIANTVSCFAGHTPPTSDETRACRLNADLQLSLAGCDWVLTLGAHALAHFHADLRITEIHGNPLFGRVAGRDVWVYPAMHPAAVLRYQGNTRAWNDDIDGFVRLLERGLGPWPDGCPTECCRCGGGEGHVWAENGLVYCARHLPKEKAPTSEQEVMLAGVRPKELTRNQQDKRRRELALRG